MRDRVSSINPATFTRSLRDRDNSFLQSRVDWYIDAVRTGEPVSTRQRDYALLNAQELQRREEMRYGHVLYGWAGQMEDDDFYFRRERIQRRNRLATRDYAPVVIAAAVESNQQRSRRPRRAREEQLALEWEAERPPHPYPYLGDDRMPPIIEEIEPPGLPLQETHITRAEAEALLPQLTAYAATGDRQAFNILANIHNVSEPDLVWTMLRENVSQQQAAVLMQQEIDMNYPPEPEDPL